MAFRFPCYRNLKRQLGALDAVCECIEVATRDLVRRTLKSETPDEFIGGLAAQHGIRVNFLDERLLKNHAIHLYIVSIHVNLEEFLVDLRREHPNGSEWAMSDDEDRLTKIARAAAMESTLAFDVCQHYRDIRNTFVHPATRCKLDKLQDQAKRLRERVASCADLAKLSAPNGHQDLLFDDFVLYTRCAKRVAEDLCEASRPSDRDLARLANKHVLNGGKQAQLSRNVARLARAKSGFLQTTFSLSQSEADKIVAEGPLA